MWNWLFQVHQLHAYITTIITIMIIIITYIVTNVIKFLRILMRSTYLSDLLNRILVKNIRMKNILSIGKVLQAMNKEQVREISCLAYYFINLYLLIILNHTNGTLEL